MKQRFAEADTGGGVTCSQQYELPWRKSWSLGKGGETIPTDSLAILPMKEEGGEGGEFGSMNGKEETLSETDHPIFVIFILKC